MYAVYRATFTPGEAIPRQNRKIKRLTKLVERATRGEKNTNMNVEIQIVNLRPSLSDSIPKTMDPTKTPTMYVASTAGSQYASSHTKLHYVDSFKYTRVFSKGKLFSC